MRGGRLLALAGILTLACGASAPRASAADPPPDLAGRWRMVAFVVDGEPVPAESVATGRLVVEGTEYRPSLDGNSAVATYKIDATTSPMAIDFTFTSGPRAGTTARGILKLEGDTLLVCRGLTAETPRPKALEAPAGSGLQLATWKRDAAATKLATEDLARFQGTWRLVWAMSDGEMAPSDRIRDVRVVIEGRTHSVHIGERVVAHDVRWEIDPTANPRQTTDTLVEGANSGKQIRGIYALADDTLVSCVGGIDQKRPAKFDAAAGTGQTLRVFRRARADDARFAEALAKDHQLFTGTWKFTSMNANGVAIPPAQVEGSTLTCVGERFETVAGPLKFSGVFLLDPTANPKRIDVVTTVGLGAGRIQRGVYEVDATTYRASFALGEGPRPTRVVEEPTKGQSGNVLRKAQP